MLHVKPMHLRKAEPQCQTPEGMFQVAQKMGVKVHPLLSLRSPPPPPLLAPTVQSQEKHFQRLIPCLACVHGYGASVSFSVLHMCGCERTGVAHHNCDLSCST